MGAAASAERNNNNNNNNNDNNNDNDDNTNASNNSNSSNSSNSLIDRHVTPDLPTKIIPAKIAWLKLSRKLHMGLGIPPFTLKILIESNPLKSRFLVRRLAVALGKEDSDQDWGPGAMQ